MLTCMHKNPPLMCSGVCRYALLPSCHVTCHMSHVVLPDLNFRGGIRFGKLLEDIDAFAGNVAFLHCNDGDPNTKVPVLVTACLDRLDIDFPVTLNLGTDLQLQGHVTWTSKSALQISIHLYPKDSHPSPDKQLTVCMYIYTHIHNYTHTHTHTHIYIYIYIYIYI
jgi:acyl-CoA hydrolase